VEALPGLAAELVRRQVDVLYATGPAAVKAAIGATSVIPIVALDLETDPVASGMVRSLASPGGNVTGLFLDQPTLAGKWLELLGDAAPGRKHVGVLWDPTTGTSQVNVARQAAQRLGVELEVHEIRTVDDLDPALHALVGKIQAIMLLSSPLVSTYSVRIARFTTQDRLPGISPFRAYAESGGLLSYGPDLPTFRRFAATYVDKILKGSKPADLPIQQPTKFQFVINQKAAKALGLTIPQSLLLRADEVIQ
jgi:putative ABC transport system substrate-binding protein